MTSSHGRRIQSRRALAILTWVTLVVVAGLLWYGQQQRIIRIQAWEPAALLLSAYAAFLSIFGWLLFSPGRKSAEESPGLFFSGMLTLLPPCFIAWHLMPVGSPLKPWLTIGVFLFGVLAIMSPLPDEVFAVPRHRRSYLQPLTNSYLSELDVSEPAMDFDSLAPRTAHWLSRPSKEPENPTSGVAHDPWADPFYGTGRQLSRIGVSRSRRSEEDPRQDRRPSADEQQSPDSLRPMRDLPSAAVASPPPLPPALQRSEFVTTEPHAEESGRQSPSSWTPTLPANPEHRTDSDRAEKSTGLPSSPSTAVPGAAVSTRRPLSEPPSQRALNPVGFQTPVPVKGSLRELDQELRRLDAEEADDAAGSSASDENSADTGASSSAPGVTRSIQQSSAEVRLERIRDEHGGEMIEGTIGVYFEVGQKRAHVHVPFSPPLPGLPEVECEPVGEDSIRLKVAVRQPYGIRIEARRSEASEALSSEISFAAVYTPASRRG